MRVLITGGAGFIGHHVVAKLLAQTDWNIVLLERLDCSGNMNRLAEIGIKRAKFVFHDLKAPISPQIASQIGTCDYVLHLAASTHVDRSITDPMSFVLDNVVGTCNLLEFVRSTGCRKMIYFSTDEVFGPAPVGVAHKEWDRYRSGNPYAATKAGAEELCIAYHNTYGVPIIVTHCMNVFGERQHPEKFIPSTISKVMNGLTVTIHADKTCTTPGSRFYIHADNVADAMLFLLKRAEVGDKYNIVGEREVSNLDMAKMISVFVGKPLLYEMVDFHSSRPGHDLRYALDGTKLKEMGWHPPDMLEAGLERTVGHFLRNKQWLEAA